MQDYLERNRAFIEGLAMERLRKYYKPEEILHHVFLIDSDSNEDFDRLAEALRNTYRK